jgi:hypothetical protein
VLICVIVALGTGGCSTQTGAAAAPSGSATGAVAPSLIAVPLITVPLAPVRLTAIPLNTVPPLAVPHPRSRTGLQTPHLGRSVPVRLEIAAIGVSSELMSLGLKPDGTIEVPPSGFPAGWFTGAPTPGEIGPAIIAGHIDWNGPGVFFNLHRLKAGDTITVTRKDRSKPVFRVTRVAQFPKDTFPTEQVYGTINRAGLRLITCGGNFNRQSGHYEDNIVAFADLIRGSQP